MRCLDENQLIELIEGLLSEQQATEAEQHLADCSSCREALSALVAAGVVEDPSEEPASMGPEEDDEEAFAPGNEVDGLVILRRLGGGGMGEVLLARDDQLGRNLALKVIKPSLLGSSEAHERFLREARATARCVHPNIVTLHAVGEHRGQPYLILEHVEGETLQQLLARRQPAIDEALRIGRGLADALAEAHRHGVLHRDLKPANVIIGQAGRPRVLDFGLAKPVTATPQRSFDGEESTVTREAGTPLYMAPEQWLGEPATEASDIWALGVILYRLLAGVHPVKEDGAADGRNLDRLRKAVAGPAAIAPLASVVPDLFAPVATLVDRCLAKKPEVRPTAQQAAQDLATLRESIALRHRRRRRRTYGFAALALLALVAVIVAVMYAGKQRESVEQRAEAQSQRLEARRQQARTHIEAAELARLQGQPLLAGAHLRSALEIEDSLLVRARLQQLDEQPLRWRSNIGSMVYAVERIAGEHRWFAVASRDKNIRLVETATSLVRHTLRGHRDQVIALASSADGRLLASGSWDGEIRIWRLRGDVPDGRVIGRHEGIVRALALSPDGHLLVSAGDNQVRLWRLRSGEATERESTVSAVAFNATATLVSASNATLHLQPIGKTKPAARQLDVRAAITSLSFSPSSELLALGQEDGVVQLLDGRTFERKSRWTASDGSLTAIAADDERIATASVIASDARTRRNQQVIRLWTAEGRLLGELTGHKTTISGLALHSPWLLSADHHGELRCWRVDRVKRSLYPSGGHEAGVLGAAFSPDGKLIASGSTDRTIRIWNVASGATKEVLRGHDAAVSRALFGPKGNWLASTSYDGTVRLWRSDFLGAWRTHQVWRAHESRVRGAVFSAGPQLITYGEDRTVRIWGAKRSETWSELQKLTQPAAVLDAAVSPDGRQLATAGSDGVVRIWRRGGGRWLGPPRTLNGHEQRVWGVTFVSSTHLASAGADGTVRSWQLARTDEVAESKLLLLRPNTRVYWLAAHRQRRMIGVPSSDAVAYLLRLDTPGEKPIPLVGHRAEVDYLRFDEGSRALTTSDDGTVRLWEVATGSSVWRTVLLTDDALLTHRGWLRFGSNDKPSSRWHQAARSAVTADLFQDTLCLALTDGRIQRWHLPKDRPVADVREASHRKTLAAVSDGCVSCSSRGAVLYNESGRHQLVDRCSAVTFTSKQILIAVGGVVRTFNLSGRPLQQHRVSNDTITALSADGSVVGLSNGRIGRMSERRTSLQLAKAPAAASTVVAVVDGPRGMTAVGFSSGLVTILSAEGHQLRDGRLHGAALHLLWNGARLVAASELGDYLIWDLRTLTASWCDILRRTRREVLVSPADRSGGLVKRVDGDHPACEDVKRVPLR